MKTHPFSSAFPFPVSESEDYGLTKREYFAAVALQGLLSKGCAYSVAADTAVRTADYLIESLNKGGEDSHG